jgi:hypothetical protein
MTGSKGPRTGVSGCRSGSWVPGKGCPAAGAAAGYPERGVRLGGGTFGSASGGGSPGRAPLRHIGGKTEELR